MSRETQVEKKFRTMSHETMVRTLNRYHSTLSDLATWLDDCRDHDADMGHEPRDADEEMVYAMMATAANAVLKGGEDA